MWSLRDLPCRSAFLNFDVNLGVVEIAKVGSGADELGPAGNQKLQVEESLPHTIVVASDDAGDAETFVVQSFDDLGSAKSSWVVDGDAVVVGIKSFDKVFVELLVEELRFWRVDIQACDDRDDTLAVVHPHETGRGELGVLAGEGGGEFALVMVVAVGGVVVDSTNINDNGACCEGFGVARADQRGIGVFGEQAEEVDLAERVRDMSRC